MAVSLEKTLKLILTAETSSLSRQFSSCHYATVGALDRGKAEILVRPGSRSEDLRSPWSRHYHPVYYRLSLPGAGADAAATETGIESWPPSISENHATPS
jgi:hypothetical protein